jgi:hypothetical protein
METSHDPADGPLQRGLKGFIETARRLELYLDSELAVGLAAIHDGDFFDYLWGLLTPPSVKLCTKP